MLKKLLYRSFVSLKRSCRRFATMWLSHKKISLPATAVALVVLGFGIWWLAKSTPTVSTSTNPIVANYQTQLPQLAKTAKQNPTSAKALQDYAVALYATGDFQKAREQYEAEAKISSNDATLQNNLGNTYRDLGQYDKAVAAYQAAIKINPKAINAYVNLANVYSYTLSKPDLGIKTYQNALANLPGNQEIQVLLATAYEQTGDKASARNIFNQILTQNPNNTAAQAGLKRLAS